ncbi:hypothetical protein VCRA2119O147_140049 [Vibrio crassostreae]|nr:hypothetical protein VCRA2114E123_100034 [Vibrio crassostreae]CAK1695064.1 hypothetical protein VCRA2113O221_100034 [Vibrio crassostreae]CAK1696436.1 hypothetical protein VCRA2113O119_100050 [Vibrio crassostreae]CAK1696449.1 hypothetical protein VCRA2117O379_100045 [Vibrio crassostreae]CAK1696571.1 hypothetical protein VCRA2113O199_100050 [Vibrio crassostreae]
MVAQIIRNDSCNGGPKFRLFNQSLILFFAHYKRLTIEAFIR